MGVEWCSELFKSMRGQFSRMRLVGHMNICCSMCIYIYACKDVKIYNSMCIYVETSVKGLDLEQRHCCPAEEVKNEVSKAT